MTENRRETKSKDRQTHWRSVKNTAIQLHKAGYSVVQIADHLGIAESSVRALVLK